MNQPDNNDSIYNKLWKMRTLWSAQWQLC